MAAKQKKDVMETLGAEMDRSQTFNPLLQALRENDKKNLFTTNVTTAFIKTGFHLFDYYFGSVINIHNELGEIINQEPRVGQAAGVFNLIIGNSGSGKAQPISTKIPTPTGYTKMGDLNVGDKVFGSDGEPTNVIGVFPQGVKNIYEITFNDGRTARCCKEHLWNILKIPKNISPFTLYDPRWNTVMLQDIMKDYEKYNYYIPASPLGEKRNQPYIENIKFSHKEEAQCIKVDARDELYLTEDFIVTHNTTIACQFAGNIIRQFPFANAIHYDCEQRFDISRAETITQLPAHFFQDTGHGARYVIKSGAVGLDTMQEAIVKLYVNKMKMKDQLMVPSGFNDEFGKPVMIFQPTVIIIDSITSVLGETFSPDNAKDSTDAEKLRGNTEGARDAKTLKGFFKDILPLCKEANIIVYAINHINTNMSMNSFVPVAKQQNFLKQDESIPGGKTMIFYPFNIIKLIAKPSDDFTEEGDGFAGHIVMFEPIKSSSNQSGNNSKGISFEMVFSFKTGFDPLRTLILYAKDRGIIEGNRNRMKFKDDPDCVFSLKNIMKEKSEKPIWENLKKYVIPKLNDHLSYIEPSETKFDDRSMDY